MRRAAPGRSSEVGREPRQNIYDFLVRRLAKIVIEIADRAEYLVVLEADDLVGVVAQIGERVGRGDGDGERELFRMACAYGLKGSPGRRAGRDAVVDDD